MKQDELQRVLSEDGLDLVEAINLEQARRSLARRLSAMAYRAEHQEAETRVAVSGR